MPPGTSGTIQKWATIKEIKASVRKRVKDEALFLTAVFGFQKQQKHELAGKELLVKSNLDNQIDHITHVIINMVPRNLAEHDWIESGATLGMRDESPEASKWKITMEQKIDEAIKDLHEVMLRNYCTWSTKAGLSKLDVEGEQFQSENSTASPGMKIGDEDMAIISGVALKQRPNKAANLYTRQVVLWFLIWGEAANLRHTPECLMLIFHSALCHIAPVPVPTPKVNEAAMSIAWLQNTPVDTYPAEDFLKSIVTPWFNCIKTCTGNTMSVPPYRTAAMDVTYDDFNECFLDPQVIKALYSKQGTSRYASLRTYLVEMHAEALRIEEANKDKKKNATADNPAELEDSMVVFKEVFEKTYREQRSWLHVYYSFKRVFTFHACLFHLLVVLAFKGWDQRYLSSVVLTHASLEFLHSLIGIFLGAKVVKLTSAASYLASQTGAPADSSFSIARITLWVTDLWAKHGILFWNTLLLIILVSTTLTLRDPHNGTFVTFALFYVIWCCLSFLSTTRDGYTTNIWQMFRRSAPVNPLSVGRGKFLQYTTFWLMVIASKAFFNYFLMIEPMAEVSVRLWERRWLNTGVDDLSPDGDLILVLLRWSAPAFMALADTSIFYILVASIWSAAEGIRQRLGTASKWFHVIRNFYELPDKFSKGVLGKEPDEVTGGTFAAEPRTRKWYEFAVFWNSVVDKLRNDDLLSNRESEEIKFFILEKDGDDESKNLARFFDASDHYVLFPCLLTSAALHSDTLIALSQDPEGEMAEEVSVVKDQYLDLAVLFLVKFGFFKDDQKSNIRSDLKEYCKDIEGWIQTQPVPAVMEAFERLKMLLVEMLQRVLYQFQMSGIHEIDERVQVALVPAWSAQSARQGFLKDLGTQMVKLLGALNRIKDFTNHSKLTAELQAKAESYMANSTTLDPLRPTLENKQMEKAVYALWLNLACQNVGCRPHVFEARRQLQFFAASLNHPELISKSTNNPPTKSGRDFEARTFRSASASTLPNIESMKSWSALVPFYGEDVVYPMQFLLKRTTEGVHLLDYLKSQYREEYANFLERVKLPSNEILKDFEKYGIAKQDQSELENWATDRGQLLARTVNGVMNNEAALKAIAKFEGYNDDDAEEIVSNKFHFVVAAQIYGQQKMAPKETKFDDYWKAVSIDKLREKYPRNLRLAYVDTKDGVSYSVCMGMKKNEETGEWEDEVKYKVKLPGNPIVGYGKPENQNHAVIFAHGEYLQVLDMNQDHYLGEAYKMRNLLEQFDEDTALVGFREHIFSESSGAVASFAASTEFTFGTLVQRFLANPLCVRFHYGHPDIFDKLWVMTRGGLSKACKDLHVSEDIFGGFNVVMRGKKVKYCEFVHCGKGRDMGFSQINGFEEKISGGNGLQCLSRDVNRLGRELDFFRLMSFYTSGPGQYVNAVVLVSAVYMFILTQVVLALSDSEVYCAADPNIANSTAGWNDCAIDHANAQSTTTYSAEWTIQLGFITILPQLVELVVEFGWGRALGIVFRQFFAGSWIFFSFVMQTKSYYFDRSLTLGGAGYIATGRGYQIQNTDFVKLYTWYARSHIYFGMELLVLLLLYLVTSGQRNSYLLTTWSVWLFGVSFVLGPWWFNPLSFTWTHTLKNFHVWNTWLSNKITEDDEQKIQAAYGDAGKLKALLNPESSWDAWNRNSLKALRCAPSHLKVYFLIRKLPLLAVTVGAITALEVSEDTNRVSVFIVCLALIWGAIIVFMYLQGKIAASNPALQRSTSGRSTSISMRVVYTTLLTFAMIGVFLGVVFAQTRHDSNGIFNTMVIAIATMSISQFVVQVASYLVLTGDPNNPDKEYQDRRKYYKKHIEDFVHAIYKLNDRAIGIAIFFCLFGLSIIPTATIQSYLLFNAAFSDDLEKTKRQAQTIRQAFKRSNYPIVESVVHWVCGLCKGADGQQMKVENKV